MKLSDFSRTIQEMPLLNHSFTIKKENWFNQDQQELIDNIFNNKDTITLNRYDLLNSNKSIGEFILKTLMWGYPTKGRGNNIDNLLKPDNFKLLTDILESYRDKDINASKLDNDIGRIKGLGLSTMSKFLCFIGARVENQETLILDRRIIEIIKAKTFDELKNLTSITYPTSVKNYVKYLETINNFSKENNTISQKVEMFIFMFGRHLSPLKGE
ncbi:hypothetical protein BXY57_1796 [Thermoflavifilum aggregans]|uniref:Uncharacterized protein n=1 Tax=Thermoflavifilum aggregans TaxID=454188 RepID=A0A2M9CWA5_9BACT|nr:hypothetical protein [Thermoflavifilum aggregans]PJJ76190.1 hypothetical protein BXY57_1796 [Thermoflavifilum aggregans]